MEPLETSSSVSSLLDRSVEELSYQELAARGRLVALQRRQRLKQQLKADPIGDLLVIGSPTADRQSAASKSRDESMISESATSPALAPSGFELASASPSKTLADYLKPFRHFVDAEVQVDVEDGVAGAEKRLRQDLEAALQLKQELETALRAKAEILAVSKAALELHQQLETVLREKSRASQEAEAQVAEDLRRVAEISEAEREKHQKLEKDWHEATETREAEQKQHQLLAKSLQEAEIRAQREHRSWHREGQRCEKLQEELKLSSSEAAELTAKVKKLESSMASSEANCNELRETVEILKSESTQERSAARKTAQDLQLSQEKLQALSVLTDQLRSEVQEARRSLKPAPAPVKPQAPAPVEPVALCYEPIAVTEQELKRSLSQPHLPRRMNGIAPPQRPQLHQVQADVAASNGLHPQSDKEIPKISTSADSFSRNGQMRFPTSTPSESIGRSSISQAFETLRAEIAAAAAHRRRVWGRPRQLSVTVESSSEEVSLTSLGAC